MNLVIKALGFAKAKHSGQVRKVSGSEYYLHPVAVSYIVACYKRSKHLDELLAASLLHDTLEDTDTTFVELATEFTPLVASLVLELSNDVERIKEVGKLEYQKKKFVGISNYGLIIKLADRLHNVSDSPTTKMIADTQEMMAFLKINRTLTGTQTQLVQEIEKMLGI